MLRGELVTLRPVRESDLDAVWAAHTDIASRGAFFPLGVVSQPEFRRRFAETGFWEKTEGTLLIIGPDDEMLGHIEFFVPVSYWDAFELSYQLYDPSIAGRGYVTEAVQLVVAKLGYPELALVSVLLALAVVGAAAYVGVASQGRESVRSSE